LLAATVLQENLGVAGQAAVAVVLARRLRAREEPGDSRAAAVVVAVDQLTAARLQLAALAQTVL
jgi:hypothetical protein